MDHVDIANADDYTADGDYNPHNVRPWLIGNEYGALAIAYARHEQDAFDIAADADLLRGLHLDEDTAREREDEYEGDGVMYLGNDDAPYDSIYAWIRELPNRDPIALSGMDAQTLYDVSR